MVVSVVSMVLSVVSMVMSVVSMVMSMVMNVSCARPQVRVLEVPIAGHSGWGGGWLLDHAMDLADFVRELAAMVYNAHLLV